MKHLAPWDLFSIVFSRRDATRKGLKWIESSIRILRGSFINRVAQRWIFWRCRSYDLTTTTTTTTTPGKSLASNFHRNALRLPGYAPRRLRYTNKMVSKKNDDNVVVVHRRTRRIRRLSILVFLSTRSLPGLPLWQITSGYGKAATRIIFSSLTM